MTSEVLRALRTGLTFFHPRPTREILSQAWKESGDEILTAWIEEHPGTRPFGWWLFVGVPTYGERRPTEYWRENHEPDRSNFLRYGILSTHCVPDMQESE